MSTDHRSRPLRAFAAVAAAAATLLSAPAARAQASDQDHLRDNVFAQPAWQELGPVQAGGRVVAIAVHPHRAQEFWVAAASGGIWHTQNGGLSFAPQFQDAYSISIGDLCIAPSDPEVLYVGTGEGNNQRSSYWGNGVYRSPDGGKTWRHVGLEHTEHIGRVAVHPTDPDIVYVAALGSLYRANDARGVYKTADGGNTWQRVHDLGPDVGFVDVLLQPGNPDTVFAASYERRRRAWNFVEGGEGSRLWKSTDAGATWQRLENGLPQGVLGRIGIDAFAGDGNVLYATIENLNPRGPQPAPAGDPTDAEPRDRAAAPDDADDADDADGAAPAAGAADVPAEVLADPVAFGDWQDRAAAAQDPKRQPRRRTVGGEVYRSDDAGRSWRKTHDADTSIGGSPGYYYGQIRVDPNDAERVYVLSVPIYRSTDGGKTWTPKRGARGAFADSLHSDHHALWIDPRDSRHCLCGNDGGLAVTWDGGERWDHLAHLPILQYYALAADQRVPYRIYGGLQDNGTWGFPVQGETSAGIAALDAFRINGGDGFQVAIDPSDPDVVYSESQFGNLSRQNLRTGERRTIKPQAKKGEQALRFNWNTPILVSPHAPHTVYVGTQFLHRSRDRGDHWQTISPDLTTNDADKLRGNVPHCTITTIDESPRHEGLLWVGTDDGRVWRSRDGGDRWVELTDRFPEEVHGLWVARVVASPHDAATAFVAFTGYREDVRTPFVFRSDDGGDSWLAIANDLPMEPINVVRQHPRRANVLLVGTEMGAYVSIDDGAHWFALGRGLPRVAVHDLIVHAREPHVLVATHGRGIWALDASLLEALTPDAAAAAFVALPPSGGVLLRRPVDRGYTGAREWRAANPFVEPTFRYLLAQDSETPVRIEVLDVTGEVLWKKDGPTEAGLHEVPWRSERSQRGPFGGRGGGLGRARGGDGPRPGTFAVRITRGEQQSVQPFAVEDRRGTSSVLGAWPDDDEQPVDDEEAEEAEAAGTVRAGEAAGGAQSGR